MKMIEDLGMSYPRSTSKQKKHFAIYECPFCGKHFKASMYDVRNGDYKSCGCHKFEFFKDTSKLHGLSTSKLYRVWHGMIERCYYVKHSQYYNYGGRGITVCDAWKNDFMAFYDWANDHGYKEGLTIDRIDGDIGYFPENCRLATRAENSRNKRVKPHRRSKYKGVQESHGRWWAAIGFNYKLIWIGSFQDEESAAMAYDKKAEELFGEFACLNFPKKRVA